MLPTRLTLSVAQGKAVTVCGPSQWVISLPDW